MDPVRKSDPGALLIGVHVYIIIAQEGNIEKTEPARRSGLCTAAQAE